MIIDASEVDKRRRERNRKKMKKDIAEDITEVFEDVVERIEDTFRRKEIKREKSLGKRRGRKLIWKLLGLAGWLGLIILVLNFVLGNIWILTKLIKSIF